MAVKPLVIQIAGRLDSSLASSVSQAQAMILRLANSNVSTTARVAAAGQLAANAGMTILKTAGIATAAAFTYATKEAMQLNKEVANIGTLSVGAERQQELKKGIQEVAIATGKATSDIADGTYQVISAYGDAADTVQKVEINAKAARAGLSTTNDSIALTTAVTKAYGDTSAAAVQKVSDLAFKTVELGQTTFPELARSMGKVSSMSTALGVSQEELFASYATLTGVTGNASQVQTQMMAVYNALLKPNKQMAQTVKNLGYESGYSMIKTLGLAGTLNALKKATNGSSEELLKLYSNQRAMPAILALTGAQSDTFATKLGKMKNAAGATDKAFETQTQGISKTSFTLEQAKVKFQVAAQQFGDSIAPMIAQGADMVGSLADKISNMSDEQRRGVASAMIWTTGIGAGLVVAGKLTTSIAQTVAFFGKLAALSGPIGSVASAAGPIMAAVGPSLAVAGGIAAAAGAIEIVDKNFNYASNLERRVSALGRAANELARYNELASQVQQQKSILANPASTTAELDAAKAKLKEIAELVGADYNMAISCDTTELDAAIAKQQMLSREDMLDAGKKVSDDVGKIGSQYRDDQATVARMDAAEPALRASEAMFSYFDTEAQRAIRKFQRTGDEAAYVQKMNELYQSARLNGVQYDQFADIENLAAANIIAGRFRGDADAARANYDYNRSTREKSAGRISKTDKDIKDASSYYSEALANDVRGGRMFEASEDITAFQELAENAREAGINTREMATQFAAARAGYTDFSAAVSDGKVGEMVQSFLDFNADIGETAENTAQGAALIANGFNDASQAIAAGAPAINAVVNDLARFGQAQGLDMTIGKVTEMANAIGLLPEGASITIDAKGNFAVVDAAGKAIEAVDGKNANMTVTADGDISKAEEAAQLAETIGDENANIDVTGSTSGIDEVQQAAEVAEGMSDTNTNITVNATDNATPVTDSIQGNLTTLSGTTASPTVTVNDQASGTLASIQSQINSLPSSKTITITTEYKTVGTPPGESATGQRNWRGGLTFVNDAHVADPREVIEYGGMRYWYSGRNVLADVPKGARIYNAQESRGIINGSHRNGLDYVPFDGYVAELHRGERVLTESEAANASGISSEINELLGMLRSMAPSDGGGLNVTYSPVINITGTADSGDIDRALRDGYEQFTRFMERYNRNRSRTSFA